MFLGIKEEAWGTVVARAKRHYIPGQVWHITHRCHQRQFLLKFAKDRKSWLDWLLKAKRRYHLVVLNYMVTSNHIHLLVLDDAGRDVIPRSMQLVAGRTAQAYNVRKGRKGAFWEDRYHATAIETGEHLLRCIVYIDMNMVRAGVVNHPAEWGEAGYNEIQNPRRKCALIAYDRLRLLLGFSTYDELVAAHAEWVGRSLKKGDRHRESKWTESIAVGSREFAESTKRRLGIRAKGRTVSDAGGTSELRESQADYIEDFALENSDMVFHNAYLWEDSAETST